MKEYAKRFYTSNKWKDCRTAYAKSVGYLCERCLKGGIYKPGEAVHHKIHLTPENISNPDVALNWDNLELLCRDCHAVEHNKKRYKINCDGTISIRHSPP